MKNYKKYKIILKNFNALYHGNDNYEQIIDILEEPAIKMTYGILNILEPGKEFVIIKDKEENTLGGAIWPKYKIKSMIVMEKGIEYSKITQNQHANIWLEYDYFNPRDGEGWILKIYFQEPAKKPRYQFYFNTHSHYIEEQLFLWVDILEEQFLKKIENFLNNLFNDEASFQEDKF